MHNSHYLRATRHNVAELYLRIYRSLTGARRPKGSISGTEHPVVGSDDKKSFWLNAAYLAPVVVLTLPSGLKTDLHRANFDWPLGHLRKYCQCPPMVSVSNVLFLNISHRDIGWGNRLDLQWIPRHQLALCTHTPQSFSDR